MKKIYKSKVDIWLIFLIIGISIISILPVLLFAFSWIAISITLGLYVFILYCFCSIEYIITDDTLNIKCGFLIDEKIKISNIVKIVPDKSILSAPAASLDRIGIYINNQKTPIIISPKNKTDFIYNLRILNPNIIYFE